jgi:prepilin-type N-terminal cleavage/methylation domain
MNRKSQGFTLIEIMIAISILAVSITALYSAQGNSLRASGRAEKIQTASLLARQVMTQKLLEIRKDMEKGSFPDESKNDTGPFEAPFDNYRWEFTVRKVEIPLAANPQEQAAPQPGEVPSGDTANQAPAAAQENLAQMVTKKISESIREINTKVIWEELGEEQSIVVTTHISKL